MAKIWLKSKQNFKLGALNGRALLLVYSPFSSPCTFAQLYSPINGQICLSWKNLYTLSKGISKLTSWVNTEKTKCIKDEQLRSSVWPIAVPWKPSDRRLRATAVVADCAHIHHMLEITNTGSKGDFCDDTNSFNVQRSPTLLPEDHLWRVDLPVRC